MGVAIIVKGVNFSKVGLGEVTKKEEVIPPYPPCPCPPECPCHDQETSSKSSYVRSSVRK